MDKDHQRWRKYISESINLPGKGTSEEVTGSLAHWVVPWGENNVFFRKRTKKVVVLNIGYQHSGENQIKSTDLYTVASLIFCSSVRSCTRVWCARITQISWSCISFKWLGPIVMKYNIQFLYLSSKCCYTWKIIFYSPLFLSSLIPKNQDDHIEHRQFIRFEVHTTIFISHDRLTWIFVFESFWSFQL